MNREEKAFSLMLFTYANPDGSNIFPSNETISSDWGYSIRWVRLMRNRMLQNGRLICLKAPTSKMPGIYALDIQCLKSDPEICREEKPKILKETVVDNSSREATIAPLGRHLLPPREATIAPNLPITYHCTNNTVGFNNSVDNFGDTGVAIEHIIKSDSLPCDVLAQPGDVNLQLAKALQALLTEKEGSPMRREADRYLTSLEGYQMAA